MIKAVGGKRSKGFLIMDKKSVLIDTSANISIKKLLNDLKSCNIVPKDLSLIIITHGHNDHFALLPKLKELTDAKVLCHPEARENLINGKNTTVKIQTKSGERLLKLFGAKDPDYPTGVEADILVKDEMDLKEFGVDAKVISTPGHTDCSLSIVTKNGEAIIGDFFLDMPFTPKPSFSFVATDPFKMKESLKKLLDMGCNTFYSSHAKVYTRGQVEKLLTK